MKRFLLLSLLFVSVSMLHTSCGLGDAAEKAEKYADKFHKHLKNKDVNGMMSMVHDEALLTQEEAFQELLTRMSEELNVKSVEKTMGFNTSINNGVATVTLNYVINDEKHGAVVEEIILRDTSDGRMKIVSLQYN